MPNENKYYDLLRDVEDAIDAFYVQLVEQLITVLSKYLRSDGTINVAFLALILMEWRVILREAFRGASGVVSNDQRVFPVSGFATLLWQTYVNMANGAVDLHRDIMRDAIADLDLRDALGAVPIANMGWVVPHEIVGTDGKTLLSRLDRVATETERRLAAHLQHMANTNDTDPINGVVLFMTPGEGLSSRTTYGTQGSIWGSRLLQNEAMWMFTAVSTLMARQNPYVNRWQSVLHPSHRCCDFCDTRSGQWFTVDDRPPPYHNFCLCGQRWERVRGATPLPTALTPLAVGWAAYLLYGQTDSLSRMTS